ncbi:flagellar regulator YcgR PilZN domain-containing protein, partial [Salmonella enterica]
GSESVITSILEVDADDDSLIIDAAPSAMLNESIVASKRIGFEALYNSIRITFNVDGARQVEYQNRPALKVGIPQSLVRLQ